MKMEAKETGLERYSVAGLHVISVGTLGYWHLLLHANGNVPVECDSVHEILTLGNGWATGDGRQRR